MSSSRYALRSLIKQAQFVPKGTQYRAFALNTEKVQGTGTSFPSGSSTVDVNVINSAKTVGVPGRVSEEKFVKVNKEAAAALSQEQNVLGRLIDGKAISAQVRKEVAEDVKKMDISPGLGVLLVGNRPDSAAYVASKTKACAECGIKAIDRKLPDTASQEEILACVDELNADPNVHGILIQLPLPPHINEQAVLSRIQFHKDVDGFSAENTGGLALKGGEPSALACTPAGVMELLKRSEVDISGKHCVVLGRSNIVGLPASLMLMHANGTVTTCHSRTPNIADHVRQADIIVAALGKPEFVRGDWLKEGAIVIDVGINAVESKVHKKGYKLVGDVNFAECRERASLITPVPGGVGPMTIAMLLKNTLGLAQRSQRMIQKRVVN